MNLTDRLFAGLGIGLVLGTILGWFLVQSNFQSSKVPVPSPDVKEIETGKQIDLKMNMRKLWEDHITWTRMFLLSASTSAADTNDVTERLLKNQEDIGDAIKPFYGNNAGEELTRLLKEHITTAADLVKATKENNQQAANTANNKWYANAESIADFLSKANPNWPKDQIAAGMKMHLDLTKQEAVNILNKKNEESIEDYDKIHDHILTMSDMLSEGVIKQFPDKF